MRSFFLLATAVLAVAGCGGRAPQGATHGLPLSFASNRGQFAPQVRFAARGPGFALAALDGGLELALGSERVRVGFAGARGHAPAAGAALPGVANYLLGRDPRRWRTGVPTYREVVYRGAWPGVDVVVYGKDRLEYDIRIAPGADPGAARLRFGAPARLGRDGSLHAGALRMLAPRASQRGRPVASRYALLPDGTVGFRVGAYDRRAPLVIDPVLTYSTSLGGTGTDEAAAIAVDAAGSAYVTGRTQSPSFPGAGAPAANGDAFVAKLTPDGSGLAWSTFLGGGGIDEGHGIALAADGVVVGGMTTSGNFPTVTPVQGGNAGNQDAFVAKLTPDGAGLVYASYLGGGGFDQAFGVAVDAAGAAYLTGTTDSADFHLASALQPLNGGGEDAFAAKLAPDGHSLTYSTYLGGTGNDTGAGVAADRAGNAYLTGLAGSADFPTSAPLQPSPGGGGDAFLTKLDAAGAARVYSTYLGGGTRDEGMAVAVGADGAPVVVGSTQSADFPHTTAAGRQGAMDAFVTRVKADGTGLLSSVFLGGTGGEVASAVAADAAGHLVVAGRTDSADFPVADPAQGTKGAGLDAFVTQYDGTTPRFSTFLGGSSTDQAAGVAVDPLGNAYVAGRTDGSFPTAAPLQPNSGGGIDAFVARLGIGSAPPPLPPVPPVPPAPTPAPPEPETTISSRPPALTPDQVVRFAFAGKVPGQLDPASGVTFGCRLDGGALEPCASPLTTPKLALAAHTFEVRAVSAGGVPDPTPAAFAFRVTKPPPEARRLTCALEAHGAFHDRGTRDWGPCTFPEIVCPRAAVCLIDQAVDEHDDSYLYNYDVHLQRDGKDRLFCFAPPLTTPVNPKLEVRFDPRRGEHNRHHACQAQAALGLKDDGKDTRLRFRCLGAGHAPKPGGDRTTGNGFEDNAHLGCELAVSIQRQAGELGEALSDSAATGPSLLVYVPTPGSLLVTAKGRLRVARVKAARAGAVRVPLRLTAAARKARRKRALTVRLTTTFTPAAGPAVTRGATIHLRRRR